MISPYLETGSALVLRLPLAKCCSVGKVALSRYGGVAQLVERLTGSQEVRGFESHRLHSKSQFRGTLCPGRRRTDWPIPALSTREARLTGVDCKTPTGANSSSGYRDLTSDLSGDPHLIGPRSSPGLSSSACRRRGGLSMATKKSALMAMSGPH